MLTNDVSSGKYAAEIEDWCLDYHDVNLNAQYGFASMSCPDCKPEPNASLASPYTRAHDGLAAGKCEPALSPLQDHREIRKHGSASGRRKHRLLKLPQLRARGYTPILHTFAISILLCDLQSGSMAPEPSIVWPFASAFWRPVRKASVTAGERKASRSTRII